jgi:sec-independent protein translocase protein TatC
MRAKKMNDSKEQSFVEHLVDLKKCIVRVLWILLIGFCACIYFSEHIFDFIRAPILPYLSNSGGLVFTAPIDKFMAHIKVSFLAGAVLTCPLWLYQIWMFIVPGLYQHEKKMGVYFISFGSLLFLLGVGFVYKIVFPMAFKYLLTFGGVTDVPMITINEYLGFFITTTLLFGLSFELPLLLTILAIIGLIDANFLRAKRRMAIMLIAILCAVVTPPDAVSMLAMLAPMLILYESSILLVSWMGKKRVTASQSL